MDEVKERGSRNVVEVIRSIEGITFRVNEMPSVGTGILLAPKQRLSDLFRLFAHCWKWV